MLEKFVVQNVLPFLFYRYVILPSQIISSHFHSSLFIPTLIPRYMLAIEWQRKLVVMYKQAIMGHRVKLYPNTK